MPADLVRLEREGPVATLVLARPDRKNALHEPMWQALADRCGELASDPPRAVIVTGEGAHFSSGMDLYPDNPLVAKLLPMVVGRDEGGVRTLIGELKGLVHALARIPCPTIAAIEGVCFGAGLEIALACDLIVGSSASRLAMMETRFGLVPDLGGMVRLSRRIGRARATDLVLTCREIDGVEAGRIGLVDRVAEPGGAVALARSMAREIADTAPTASRECLHALRRIEMLSDDEAFSAETGAGARALISGEVIRGVEAFAMKKKPEWS